MGSSQAATTRTFVGKILRVIGNYVLQVDDATTYKLAGSIDAAQFETKNVKVEGVLDPQRNIVHVTHIALL